MEATRNCVTTDRLPKESGFGYTLSIIGGKYKLTVLHLLAEHQTIRYNELQRLKR